MLSTPNLLTAFRLIIFAGFIYLVDQGNIWWAVLAFILAWGLDAIDGVLARSLRQTSDFGYLFDKMTDRIIIFGGLLVLLVYAVVPIYAFFILTKDVIVGLGLVFIHRGGRIKDLGGAGKAMMAGQGAVILWLMSGGPMGWAAVMVVAVWGLFMGGKYLISYSNRS